MVDVVLGDLVRVLRQVEPVGGHAELDVRRLLREHAEGLEGATGVGQGIAGSGDAEHRHLRNLRRDGLDLLEGLVGGEQLGHHARPRFVGAVVLAVAVVALDVAGRRHRHVHAGEVVVGVLGVARVILHLGADLVREVGERIRCAAAAAGRAATTFGGDGGIADDWEVHDPAPVKRCRYSLSNRCASAQKSN